VDIQATKNRPKAVRGLVARLSNESYSCLSNKKKERGMDGEDMKLVFKIDNVKPVELQDLAMSMLSLGDEYRRFANVNAYDVAVEEVRLYVKEIRAGSIITELMAMTPFALPLVSYASSVVDFTGHIVNIIEFFSGKKTETIGYLDKRTLENVSTILEPVARDHGSQLNLSNVTIHGDVTLNLTINSMEANAAQNGIRKRLETMKEPVTGIHEQVVMYWAQARNQEHSDGAGDRAKIESIYHGAVKVKFADDDIKYQMLFKEPHPFRKGYLVDVAVEAVEDKPVLYRVLKLHEVIPLD
jgi:hypothetical protein